MKRVIVGVCLTLGLAGCTTAAPNVWLIYTKAAYTYGRIEAKAETHCAAPIPPDRAEVCREAARVQAQIQALTPVINAELSRNRPDWDRIMSYVDLILSLAGKFL